MLQREDVYLAAVKHVPPPAFLQALKRVCRERRVSQ